MDTGEKVMLLGGLAVGGYFVYQNFFANQVPADAEYGGTIPIGTPVQVPASWTGGLAAAPSGPATTQQAYLYAEVATGTLYTSFTAPTAAQTAALAASQASSNTPPSPPSNNGTTLAPTTGGATTTTPTTGSSTATPVTSAPTSTPATTATYPAPGGGTAPVPTTLSGLWSAMNAWFANDTNFTGSPLSAPLDHINFYLTYVWATPPQPFNGVWPPNLAEVFPGVDGSTVMPVTTYWTSMLPYLQGQGLSGYGLGCGCDGGGGGLLVGMLTGAALLLALAYLGGPRQ